MAQPTSSEHKVIQTSAVYLLGCANFPPIPPPSPPSPPSPQSPLSPQASLEDDCEIEVLSLSSGSATIQDSGRVTPIEENRIGGAVHVLRTEATALHNVTRLYETDPIAREGFTRAVAAITRHGGEKGKLVIIGVGKSGHIGKKLVATFNSLAVHSTFLHPTEALHGDLGTIGKYDTILYITFSGKTQELLSLLPHIDASLPQIILTSHTQPDTCEIIKLRKEIILLPAPIIEPEALSFGVCAPTTSTTLALAVGDALAIVASQELHSCVASVFAQNHPGGAIGAAHALLAGRSTATRTILDIATPMADIPVLYGRVEHSCAEVLRSGYSSKNGWVRVGELIAPPMRIRKLASEDLTRGAQEVQGLLVERRDMVAMSANTDLKRARDMVKGLLDGSEGDLEGDAGCTKESVVAVVQEGEIVGVIEVCAVLGLE